MKLVEIPQDDLGARADLVAFVNTHYKSELPVDDGAFGYTVFFWAVLHSGDDPHPENGKRVGCTGYVKKTAFLAESVKTVVDPVFRGKGAGVAISQAIEDEVRRRGFKKIMTTILIGNLPMIFIKLKQGFIVEGMHMDHEKPGLHEYSLGKVLR